MLTVRSHGVNGNGQVEQMSPEDFTAYLVFCESMGWERIKEEKGEGTQRLRFEKPDPKNASQPLVLVITAQEEKSKEEESTV